MDESILKAGLKSPECMGTFCHEHAKLTSGFALIWGGSASSSLFKWGEKIVRRTLPLHFCLLKSSVLWTVKPRLKVMIVLCWKILMPVTGSGEKWHPAWQTKIEGLRLQAPRIFFLMYLETDKWEIFLIPHMPREWKAAWAGGVQMYHVNR